MGKLKQWFTSSTPTVKMFMAISITSIFFVSYRWYISPYVKRQRHLNAEAWANMIIEQEAAEK